MGFFDKLFGGKSKDENTAKFTNQSKTVLTPLQGKVLAQADLYHQQLHGWGSKITKQLAKAAANEEGQLQD